MPLERKSNQLVFAKIIKIKNLKKEICLEYINNMKDIDSYKEHQDIINNSKYWRGFTQNYIYSYKEKKIKIKNRRSKIKIFNDSGINNLKINKENLLYNSNEKKTE